MNYIRAFLERAVILTAIDGLVPVANNMILDYKEDFCNSFFMECERA